MSTAPRALAGIRSRRTPVILALTLVAIACGESPLVLLYSGPMPRLDLSVWVLDAGDTIPPHWVSTRAPTQGLRLAANPGLLVISGTLWPGEVGGHLRRVTLASVAINGTTALGIRQPDGTLRFGLEAPFPRSADSLDIALPEVQGAEPSSSIVGVGLATHAKSEPPTVSSGGLRLPIIHASRPTTPLPRYRRWALELRRGEDRSARVDGSADLPADLVVPIASILSGIDSVDVRLSDDMQWYDQPVPGRETNYIFSVRVVSTLRWRVAPPEGPR